MLFKGNFSQEKPNRNPADDAWDKLSEVLLSAGFPRELKVPIEMLSHVTHNGKANKIKPTDLRQGSYIFKSYPKFGKDYKNSNGTYVLNSISDDKAIKVEKDEEVFPGKYSWWGLNIHKWYDHDQTGKQIQRMLVENLFHNHSPTQAVVR